MRVLALVAIIGVMAVSPKALGVDAPAATAHRPAAVLGQLAIVQAVPGTSVDVAIDGRSVQEDIATGEVWWARSS